MVIPERSAMPTSDTSEIIDYPTRIKRKYRNLFLPKIPIEVKYVPGLNE